MTSESILAPIAALALPNSGDLTGRAQRALAFVQEYQIASAEDYSLAADELRAIKKRQQGLEEQRTGITGPINQALRAINALFKGPGDLLDQAEQILKGKMLAYEQEQRRIAAEQLARAEAAAAAERKRLADEAAARQAEADAAAQKAQQAQQAGNEQEAALASAAALRAQSEAAATATQAQLVVAAPIVVAPPVAKGISTSTKIDFDVTSLRHLVAYIATGKTFAEGDPALVHPELLALIKVDETKLRAYVRGLGTACNLPGVRVYETAVMSARAAA